MRNNQISIHYNQTITKDLLLSAIKFLLENKYWKKKSGETCKPITKKEIEKEIKYRLIESGQAFYFTSQCEDVLNNELKLEGEAEAVATRLYPSIL